MRAMRQSVHELPRLAHARRGFVSHDPIRQAARQQALHIASAANAAKKVKRTTWLKSAYAGMGTASPG